MDFGNPIYKQILDEIEKELQIHPHYADLQNQFALLLRMEGEVNKAETHFLEAIRLNPRYREAILNLGFLYMELRRWKEAEAIFLSEVKRHPKDGFLHHILGILYLQTGRQKEAAPRIHKAIQSHNYFRDYYKKKGVQQREVVHFNRNAERAFKKVHLNHHDAQFHNFIGL